MKPKTAAETVTSTKKPLASAAKPNRTQTTKPPIGSKTTTGTAKTTTSTAATTKTKTARPSGTASGATRPTSGVNKKPTVGTTTTKPSRPTSSSNRTSSASPTKPVKTTTINKSTLAKKDDPKKKATTTAGTTKKPLSSASKMGATNKKTSSAKDNKDEAKKETVDNKTPLSTEELEPKALLIPTGTATVIEEEGTTIVQSLSEQEDVPPQSTITDSLTNKVEQSIPNVEERDDVISKDCHEEQQPTTAEDASAIVQQEQQEVVESEIHNDKEPVEPVMTPPPSPKEEVEEPTKLFTQKEFDTANIKDEQEAFTCRQEAVESLLLSPEDKVVEDDFSTANAQDQEKTPDFPPEQEEAVPSSTNKIEEDFGIFSGEENNEVEVEVASIQQGSEEDLFDSNDTKELEQHLEQNEQGDAFKQSETFEQSEQSNAFEQCGPLHESEPFEQSDETSEQNEAFGEGEQPLEPVEQSMTFEQNNESFTLIQHEEVCEEESDVDEKESTPQPAHKVHFEEEKDYMESFRATPANPFEASTTSSVEETFNSGETTITTTVTSTFDDPSFDDPSFTTEQYEEQYGFSTTTSTTRDDFFAQESTDHDLYCVTPLVSGQYDSETPNSEFSPNTSPTKSSFTENPFSVVEEEEAARRSDESPEMSITGKKC